MKTFLFGLMLLGLMATTVMGICGAQESGTAPATSTPTQESAIQEGPRLISEGKYDQVLNLIKDLPAKEGGDAQIKTLEYFANIKGWKSGKCSDCKKDLWILRTALIKLGGKETTPMLLIFLKDKDPYLRLYAAELLSHIGDKRALKDLREAGEKDENKKVRRDAKWAYEQISGEKF
jgi:HEAT repeat protein